MKYVLIAILTIAMFLFWVFPNKLVRNTRTRTLSVELKPDHFIEFKKHEVNWDLRYGSFMAVHILPIKEGTFFQKDTTYISVPWENRELLWVGLGDPISIREYNGLLYMIIWDRESNFHKIRYRYFKQVHDIFAEISWNEYPRNIAVCNLESNDFKCLNDMSKLKKSATARIWYNLEHGIEYYEQPEEIGTEFLEAYIHKYNIKK